MGRSRKVEVENMPSTKLKRSHLSPLDAWKVAWQGVASRPQRSFLAAIGIAVGVAALVALTGISDSNRAALMEELDSMGANLLVVQPANGPDGKPVPLPASAVDAIRRQDGVEAVGGLKKIPDSVHAYRTDVVAQGETNGLGVMAATPSLYNALGASMESGSWFDEASRALPTVVLGAEAAARLGKPTIGDRLWIGNEWYSLLGVLSPIELAEGINTAVLLGDQWSAQHFANDPLATGLTSGDWSQIYVQSAPGGVADLRDRVAAAASPGSPHVAVAALSDLGGARTVADTMLETLGLALGGIALAVGGVGIANTMVVSVMERRGEIGLRRALGARSTQMVAQFLTESTVLSFLGACGGVILGVAAALGFSTLTGTPIRIPLEVAGLGLGVALVVGALAGLQPAAKAARMPPVEALRSS